MEDTREQESELDQRARLFLSQGNQEWATFSWISSHLFHSAVTFDLYAHEHWFVMLWDTFGYFFFAYRYAHARNMAT
jgi:hypothetical protein